MRIVLAIVIVDLVAGWIWHRVQNLFHFDLKKVRAVMRYTPAPCTIYAFHHWQTPCGYRLQFDRILQARQ